MAALEHGPLGAQHAELVFESRFIDRGVIGEGGMAWVHRVYDQQLGRCLALKVLKPECSERARRRFLQETMVTAQLDHPAIVPVHCVGVDGHGRPNCFAMKLIDGETLAHRLGGKTHPMRGDELAAFLRDMLRVCDAMAFAHSRGVIHCDLKPDNLMFGRFGEVYVMDWGVALARTPSKISLPDALREPLAGVCGTPAYMAPEQARGLIDSLDERCDVFALGGLLYEVLTLNAPHGGHSSNEALMNAAWTEVTPPDLLREDEPPPAELSDIVMRALALSPDERYSSVAELRLALERFLHAGTWFARRRFPKGACIIREGEHGTVGYFVERGRCIIYGGHGDDRRVLREVGPGEMFGELTLFASSVRTASVECLTDTVLLEISQEAVDRELPEGSWTRRIIDTIGKRFVEYDRERRRERR